MGSSPTAERLVRHQPWLSLASTPAPEVAVREETGGHLAPPPVHTGPVHTEAVHTGAEGPHRPAHSSRSAPSLAISTSTPSRTVPSPNSKSKSGSSVPVKIPESSIRATAG